MQKDTPKKEREFGVILESIDSKVQHIVEAVDIHTKQLERLEPIETKLDKIDDRLAAVETILGGTETEKPLKQRVEDLEVKVSTR